MVRTRWPATFSVVTTIMAASPCKARGPLRKDNIKGAYAKASTGLMSGSATTGGRPDLTLILNILWFIFGGFAAGLAWLFAGLLLAVTIVGLPWAAAAFRIGLFSFMPFGKEVVHRRGSFGGGPFDFLLNVIWFVLGGWYIALAHLVIGVIQMIFIVTIPFGLQHFKLAAIALAPVGKEVVEI
jgi:uncharacterized membrane protein YccF (DUF307 family)